MQVLYIFIQHIYCTDLYSIWSVQYMICTVYAATCNALMIDCNWAEHVPDCVATAAEVNLRISQALASVEPATSRHKDNTRYTQNHRLSTISSSRFLLVGKVRFKQRCLLSWCCSWLFCPIFAHLSALLEDHQVVPATCPWLPCLAACRRQNKNCQLPRSYNFLNLASFLKTTISFQTFWPHLGLPFITSPGPGFRSYRASRAWPPGQIHSEVPSLCCCGHQISSNIIKFNKLYLYSSEMFPIFIVWIIKQRVLGSLALIRVKDWLSCSGDSLLGWFPATPGEDGHSISFVCILLYHGMVQSNICRTNLFDKIHKFN